MNARSFTKLAIGSICALALVGCASPAFFSVGGTIPTQDQTKVGPKYKANFVGFFNACSLSNPYGHITYHDKYATEGEVRLEGLVEDGAECVDFGLGLDLGCSLCQEVIEANIGDFDFPEQGYLGYARIHYRSQDSKAGYSPNNGTAYLCVADFGEGANAFDSDYLLISVTSGPYEGYFNVGAVQGNIQQEECVD